MNRFPIILIFLFLPFVLTSAQKKDETKDLLKSSTFNGLKFRNIGPAWNSGRISDFAINPNNFSEYYVAVSSGGLWKTVNSGTTWTPIADTIQAYAMGCVVLDPNNPYVVWLGTGENNHQRALGYGTGVYKSVDGGQSWKHMGLKDSRQIGGIAIDPRNSNVVYVAAEGSVWGSGGERGLYKSTDGGNTWNNILKISENTGVNNIIFDPRNPDILIATSEQRRRHVFTKIGGGPETAVYKSTDAGATWEKIMKGLPSVDLGGMGIAISPANPDVIYLSVEAAEKQGGFFRSTNRGASWEKMSDVNSKGQYFNEIICDPKNVDKIFLMDVYSKVTLDGGKTWKNVGQDNRHVDDHAMWIEPNNPQHFLIGGDGGIYETFDGGNNWLFKANLPVTQFYRVNVDNDLPFYNVYGGTQDNQSMGGPSQTISADGIINSDWFMTNGGDGFWTAIDPTNPNIVYAESQYGGMVRFDKQSGEILDIRPEPGKGEKTYKWYWDAPFFISPHSPTRLYCAAEKVFRSEDRGDSWQLISDDLTQKLDRNSFKVMDKYWSIDAVEKNVSTSQYGLIVSLAESPIKENLLFAGTDDGLIQISEDATTWRKIEEIPGVPEFTFVSDILPSRFDENVVYATFNNHKRDDFKPYVLRSNDKGKSWKSIAGNLPENGAVNTIVEDPEKQNLLFIGTEWGIFFTIDGGVNWIQLKSGLPTIKVPDIVIQEREKDLVLATFGRGFYIMDDYSSLRMVDKDFMNKEAFLFPVKDALMYIPKYGKYGQGSAYFKAANPEYGAVFTYYLKEAPKTLKAIRKEKEKELFKKGEFIPQPTVEELKLEIEEKAPYLIFKIFDEDSNLVRKINSTASAGINRVTWDLRYESPSPITLKDGKYEPTEKSSSGLLAMPGKYFVTMSLVVRGEEKKLSGPVDFNAVVLNNTTLPAANRQEVVEFQKKASQLAKTVMGSQKFAEELVKRNDFIRQALNSYSAPFELLSRANSIAKDLADILFKFNGSQPPASREEIPPAEVPLVYRLETMIYTQYSSTSNVTKNQKVAYDVLFEEIQPVIEKLKQLNDYDLKSIENDMDRLNIPWTPGRIPELKK